MIKSKTWILLIGILLILCITITAFLYLEAEEPMIVEVLQDGKRIKIIDIANVKAPYTFIVEDPDGGSNTICVEPKRICITEADCPDHVCVKRGWLGENTAPIVCLPHKLVIQTANGSNDIDTMAQ